MLNKNYEEINTRVINKDKFYTRPVLEEMRGKMPKYWNKQMHVMPGSVTTLKRNGERTELEDNIDKKSLSGLQPIWRHC